MAQKGWKNDELLQKFPSHLLKKNHKWKFAVKTEKTYNNINKGTCFWLYCVGGRKFPSSLVQLGQSLVYPQPWKERKAFVMPDDKGFFF